MKIAHVVNPYRVQTDSRAAFVQAVTYETMRTAADFSRNVLQVELWAALYPEDAAALPEGFIRAGFLERSVGDVSGLDGERRLPLISDILSRLFHESDADYLVYTNSDIALMPFFYTAVARFIREGLRSFVINRRTISDTYTGVEQIPVMYAETGMQHEGFDCFVFRREDFPAFWLGQVCIGAIGIGRLLLWNMLLHARPFHLFRGNHLTFHLGNDTSWLEEAHRPYNRHNIVELKRFYERHTRGYRQGDPANPLFPFEGDLEVFGIRPGWRWQLRRFKNLMLNRVVSRLQGFFDEGFV